ncbi:MAG TPA: DUF2892 domain-containing protein [Anaerolineales bacterium]|nr:DUF2892 domain-containing protein [Anaerolineales bacterium]
MFKRNVGMLDRIARLVLGIVLLPSGLFLFGGLQGNVLGLVIAGLGLIGLVTGLTGFCLLYVPFGINTLEKEKELVASAMSRCMPMMASFRQGTASSEDPSAGQMCGPCPPMVGNTRNEQV